MSGQIEEEVTEAARDLVKWADNNPEMANKPLRCSCYEQEKDVTVLCAAYLLESCLDVDYEAPLRKITEDARTMLPVAA